MVMVRNRNIRRFTSLSLLSLLSSRYLRTKSNGEGNKSEVEFDRKWVPEWNKGSEPGKVGVRKKFSLERIILYESHHHGRQPHGQNTK